jgi:hypothetical protein
VPPARSFVAARRREGSPPKLADHIRLVEGDAIDVDLKDYH